LSSYGKNLLFENRLLKQYCHLTTNVNNPLLENEIIKINRYEFNTELKILLAIEVMAMVAK